MDEIDQKIVLTILDNDQGGAVGVGTIAALIYEKAGIIKEVYERYFIHPSLLSSMPRGYVGTRSTTPVAPQASHAAKAITTGLAFRTTCPVGVRRPVEESASQLTTVSDCSLAA